jgi:RHS repeat-associated protein
VGNLAATTFADGTRELRLPDAVGNLFRTADRQDQRYGPAGQLLEANGTRYAYDALGNLSKKTLRAGQEWHYSWNSAGHLAEVVRPDGGVVRFQYDALGRRVSKSYKGKVTRWVWDGDKPLHEWTELEVGAGQQAANEVLTWLFEDGSFAPLAKLQGQERHSILSDHLGTPVQMHDAHGQRVWAAELDSYGRVRRLEGGAACPFRYQGQYEDIEAGLYYNRFRYYDPEAGQYMSQDPVGLWGGELNFYSYVHNPSTWVDALGLNGFLFRGDDFYRKGSDIGNPLGSSADIETPWEHVRRESKGESSKFTSFSEERSKAANFSKRNKIIKVPLEDLHALEREGKIKIHTPDSVKETMKNSGNRRLAKDANNVAEIMRKNKEVLIEGVIPEKLIHCGSFSNL